MRYIFSIFLIFAIFGFSLTDELSLKKAKLIAKGIRDVLIHRQLQRRRLQEAQDTSVPSNSTEPEDNTRADEDAKEVNPSSPVSRKGINVGNPYSAVQIVKFYDFTAVNNLINLAVKFFFF